MVPLLANPPCEVHFAGWRSTTHELGANGWKFSLEEDVYYKRSRMLLYHEATDLKMMAESTEALRARYPDTRYASFQELHMTHFPVFIVKQAFSKMTIREVGLFPFEGWNDSRPQGMMVEEKDLMDFPLFMKVAAPVAEELIVEPQDVMALLDQIKRMQAPGQAEIRKNRRREEVPLVHASILTFPMAA